MEKYENPEYEMLKNSTEHIVQETSTNNKKVNTPSDTANLKGIASLVLGLITILVNHLWYVSLITGINNSIKSSLVCFFNNRNTSNCFWSTI